MSRRRLIVLALAGAVFAAGVHLAYQSRPEWFIAVHLLSVKGQPQRRSYEREVAQLSERAAELRAAGKPEPEIARLLFQQRRELGTRYKALVPEPLRRRLYDVNAQRYGDPLGPTFEWLVKQHSRDGVTDWRAISDGAARTHEDVDRLLRGEF